MIDRYLLRYFLAVVDRGSFTRAAAHCGVSQPTLSVGISRLESEVGTTLLLRNNKRIELTAAGVRWLDRARRIEREFTLAEQETQLSRSRPTLRIGVISTLPSEWMEAAMKEALLADAAYRIEIVEGVEKSLLTQLDRSRLDVLLTVVRATRAKFSEPIYEEPYGLVMPVDHRLAHAETIQAEDVADSAMIVRRHCEALAETSRHFTSRGVRPFMSARLNSDNQAIAYVRAGQGLTVMPFCFADHGVAMARLSGFDITRTIGFVYDRIASERPRSDALEAIRASVEASSIGLDLKTSC